MSSTRRMNQEVVPRIWSMNVGGTMIDDCLVFDYDAMENNRSSFGMRRRQQRHHPIIITNHQDSLEATPEEQARPEEEQERETRECCSICLDVLNDGSKVILRMPPNICSHAFHALCILRWLQVNDTCPLCRRNIYYCMLNL